jgi:hypothetical protein
MDSALLREARKSLHEEDKPKTYYDQNYYRYVGYGYAPNACYSLLFSKETVSFISKKITELTLGIDPKNRPIIVPDDKIIDVLNQIYFSFRPSTGDIYGRYNIPTNEDENYVKSIVDQCIEVIFSDIKNSIGMEQYNSTLSVWTTLLGDFNEHGLRSHPPLKISKNRDYRPYFFENY